jgi:tetratricopeptide (TPR) repeat protein/predicted Ser/Thr protein kinase
MAAVAEGSLSAEAREAALVHVHACEACTRWLAQLLHAATLDATVRADGAAFGERPGKIGRYPITGRLGAGGMGAVWLGVDPELGREVAIKRVRAGDARLRGRFFREATALAALSHPNVVPIYEVGEEDGVPFLVMERVDGRTLQAWIAARPPWTEVVEILSQAGRGLAAAHAAGIVHRDFKPANVLLGSDGRVRVVDFGLAASVDAESSRPVGSVARSPSVGDHSDPSTLTDPGTVLGTPRYMAPEQFSGQPSGPAADQYAFCIVLFEALTGRPPFEGKNIKELLRQRCAGLPRAAAASLPTALRRLVERGLDVDPARRWPSMDALCRALESRLRPRQRQKAAAIGGLLLVATVPIAVSTYAAGGAPCEEARRHLDGVWDEARQAEAAAAMKSSTVPFAGTTWPHLREQLDAYADRWVTEHRDACEATAIHRRQSSEVLDLRMACLDRARERFDHTVGLLADADVDTLRAAAELVDSLPGPQRCADVTALEDRNRPDDPALAAAVADAELVLERTRAEIEAGGYSRAAERLDTIDATALSHEPLRAAVFATRGEIELRERHFDAAETELTEAMRAALAAGDAAVLLDAAILLAQVIGVHRVRFAEAKRLFELAQGLSRRDGADGAAAVKVAWLAAELAHIRGDVEEARREAKRAVELALAWHGERSTAVAKARRTLAQALIRAGEPAAAVEQAKAAFDIHSQLLGDAHPSTILARTTWATTRAQAGEVAAGREELQAALEALVEAMGENSADVALTQINLASLLVGSGRDEESLELARAGMTTMERTHGADHEHTLRARAMLGARLASLGELEAAERELREVARGLRERPAWFMTTAQADLVLAGIVSRQGRIDEAAKLHETVIAELRADGARPRELGFALEGLAGVLDLQDREADALPHLQEARQLLESSLGRDANATLHVRTKIAEHLEGAGQLEAAEEEFRAVLERQRALLGLTHQRSVGTTTILAVLLRQQGRYEEARALLEPVHAAGLSGLAPEFHAMIGGEMGLVLAHLGERDAARPLIKAAIGQWENATLKASFGAERQRELQHWLDTHPRR